MEKSSYAMAKFGLEAKEAMPKRDCGFYVKYIFLFTSLIQFLIILGLVLFMVYGNAQAGTDTHLRLLEEQLELLKHECDSLRSDVSYSFQRIKMLSPHSCSAVHDQLSWLTQRTEGLFLWQQERETKYVGKSVCDGNLLQCRINCSGEKRELEKRLQDVEKQVKGGQEEKKKLLVEKEQLSKELEEKSKAAAQAGHFKEQLNICMGSKVRELHGDVPAHPPRERTYIFLLRMRFCTCVFFCTRIFFCTCTSARASFFCKHTSARPRAGTSRCSTLGPPSPRGAVPSGAAVPALTATARSPPQMDAFFDITGSRLPAGSGRPGPFASTGSYADALRNQGIFGNMGKINAEEIQRSVQKIMEQYTSTLKNPR